MAQSESKFIPFTVIEQDARDLRAYLDEQPMKFALPILQWMDRLETQAQLEAAPEEHKVAAE